MREDIRRGQRWSLLSPFSWNAPASEGGIRRRTAKSDGEGARPPRRAVEKDMFGDSSRRTGRVRLDVCDAVAPVRVFQVVFKQQTSLFILRFIHTENA